MEGIGTTFMGRNMFGPVRGPWDDEEWTVWWGAEPPFHHDVFLLTHHPRPPLEMAGGTTFPFVTDGIEAAPDRARAAAGDGHVRLGGGVATVREYLRAGLLDELHLAVVPVLLGSGGSGSWATSAAPWTAGPASSSSPRPPWPTCVCAGTPVRRERGRPRTSAFDTMWP